MSFPFEMQIKYLISMDLINNPHPRMIEVDLTNYCPVEPKCFWCNSKEVRSKKRTDMTLEKLRTILDEAANYPHGCGIDFTGGGEPCCHPDFKGCVDLVSIYVNKGKIPGFALVSSGYNKEIIDNCRYFLINTSEHKSWIRISLNDRDMSPELLKLINEFPKRVGISMIYGNGEQESSCIFSEMEIRNKGLPVKFIRVRKALDFDNLSEIVTPESCEGKLYHKIIESDGTVSFCCNSRGRGGKSKPCPAGCRWEKMRIEEYLKLNLCT